jgi:predicted kinase
MSNESKLIIVTGLPGSGKTSIAQSLQHKLNMPLVSKDSIKEVLFDELGYFDREWSKKIGQASFTLMDAQIKELLSRHISIIVEANFKPDFDSKKFQKWIDTYNCSAVQIVCKANNQVLFDRFKQRALSNERHPGHDDANQVDEWRAYFSDPNLQTLPLDIASKVIEVDTLDFNTVSIEKIAKQI